MRSPRWLRTRKPTAEELIPPRKALPKEARYAKMRDFRQAGVRFLDTAKAKGLEPHDRVLDLGSGPGRFAVALAGFLDDDGSYVGLDTSKPVIDVGNEWIASKLPNFEFVWADVFNASYNRKASEKAAAYRFPFDDASFDFVFSNSLFTHLVPDDASSYLHEIGRVLKDGGRTLNTIFLLNEQSVGAIEGEDSRHYAPHPLGDVARAKRADRPEAWIAFDEAFVRDAHAQADLQIEEIRYGSWSGREPTGPGFGTKDIIVATKP